MTIALIVLVILLIAAITAGVFMYLEIQKLKAERVYLEAWTVMVMKQCRFYDADSKQPISALTEHEVSHIRERRLRENGAQYCQSCGKIAGLRYKYKNGQVKGVTIQRVEVNGRQELRCTNCIPEMVQSKGGK